MNSVCNVSVVLQLQGQEKLTVINFSSASKSSASVTQLSLKGNLESWLKWKFREAQVDSSV